MASSDHSGRNQVSRFKGHSIELNSMGMRRLDSVHLKFELPSGRVFKMSLNRADTNDLLAALDQFKNIK